jgi:tetratricopeptide (TPR) repeat protein
MFTINIYVKFALIALTLVGGIGLVFAFGFLYALPFLLVGIGLLISYILLGTVQSAAQLVQTNQFDEAEKRLNLTFKPEWLYSANRAYYNMIKGSLAAAKKDMEGAEKYFSKAQGLGVSSDNETAMLELQLANIAATKNKWQQAKIHYKKLKTLKVTEPQIKEQIQQFEKALKQRGVMKAAGRAGINPMRASAGGKRRRPKMR